MPDLYKDHDDEALHRRAIERLAQKIDRPVARVKAVYETEYARLMSVAKITDYVGVFASRHARDLLLREVA